MTRLNTIDSDHANGTHTGNDAATHTGNNKNKSSDSLTLPCHTKTDNTNTDTANNDHTNIYNLTPTMLILTYQHD